jgi:HEAT repeat protein
VFSKMTKAAVPILIEELKTGKPRAKARAAEALGRIKDERAIEPLVRALAEEEWIVDEQARRALVSIGPPAVDALIEVFRNKGSGRKVRRLAGEALTVIPSPRGRDALGAEEYGFWVYWSRKPRFKCTDPAGSLAAALRGRRSGPLRWALDAIEKSGEPWAIDPLLVTLERAFFADQVKIAFKAVGSPAVEPLFVTLTDPNWVTRQRAAIVLGAIGDERALEPLCHVLLRDGDQRVRALAALALGELGDERAGEALTEALADRLGAVRERAARALGMLKIPGAVDKLKELAASDKYKDVRKAAAAALNRITGKPEADFFVPFGEEKAPPLEPATPRAVEIDEVTSRLKDTACKGVEWLIYKTKFVARVEEESLRNFEEFLQARGLDAIKVNGLAFTKDAVWAATDRGAFCYEREHGAWLEYAVNREHIGIPIESIRTDEKGRVLFELKVDGKPATYAFDPRTEDWEKP